MSKSTTPVGSTEPMDMQTWRDGHSRAVDAADTLRAALAAVGLPERVWCAVRPQVTHKGTPYVHLGMLRADHVKQIAEALHAAAASAEETPAR